METQINLTKTKLSVSFFFLSLGVLISLITSVIAFLNLVFESLNKKYPDVLNAVYQYGYSNYQYESMRIALATLIIFFPVFILISYFWEKVKEDDFGSIDQIIKKWVIYIILFLSSIVIIVDLVTLVRYFISGEITNRFILKVLSALLVSLVIGFYYMFLLKNKKKILFKKIIILFSVVLVMTSIIYSFSIMGSPKTQRLLRLDDRRVNDLQDIQYQVINYWQQKEKLPENIKELSNPMTRYSLPLDPEFEKGKVYEYFVKDKLVFELCATFSLEMPKGWNEYTGGRMPMEGVGFDKAISYPSFGGINESWDHKEGRTCFERTIDKDIYPPFPKPEKL